MAQIREPSGSVPERFESRRRRGHQCEDVRKGSYNPHTSKTNTRLTTGELIIIAPGFSTITVGRFFARHLGDFM
jgi:hypothetical protein